MKYYFSCICSERVLEIELFSPYSVHTAATAVCICGTKYRYNIEKGHIEFHIKSPPLSDHWAHWRTIPSKFLKKGVKTVNNEDLAEGLVMINKYLKEIDYGKL